MASRSAARVCAIALLCLAAPLTARADKLHITSNPTGATVEIDGVTLGVTPFEQEFPGGYFHKTRTSLAARLEHPMVARVSMEGFATQELVLTIGPMEWIGLNGRPHGEYWLIKSRQFHVELPAISQTFTGAVNASVAPVAPEQPELSLEELTARAKPAVIYLKTLDKSGTGFFVTETGLLATNAHLAHGEETILATMPNGDQRSAKVVFIDADLDIALAKIDGGNFPHLVLADAARVKQGEEVLAIGNPGDAMLFSVTKGIVSAVGPFPGAGPGTWIQTDAQINPGNSGGPLMNTRGEVIGINSQKLIKKGVTGIGFALSASDLLKVLKRFYPGIAAPAAVPVQAAAGGGSGLTDAASPLLGASPSAPAAPPATEGTGTVTITSEPDGAEIYIDGKFFGNTPAILKVGTGAHVVTLKFPGYADWQHTLEVTKGSKATLKAALEPPK